MNDENFKIVVTEDDDKGRMNISRPLFILSMLAMFFLGMLLAIGAGFFIPTTAQVVTAESIRSMSFDELDEYYNSKELRVVGAEVEDISNDYTFLITNVGNVFFENDEDIYMVRSGERFTFIGRLVIDDGSHWFTSSEFVSLYEEEEK